MSDGGTERLHLTKYATNLDTDSFFGSYSTRFFFSFLQADRFPEVPWYSESFTIFTRVRYNDGTEQEMFSGATGFITISLKKNVNNQIEFALGDNNGFDGLSWIIDTPVNVVRPGEWHTIACSYDKAASTARIYVDGVLQIESASCPPAPFVWDSWRIGMDHRDENPLHANINELIIYDGVISDAELRRLQKRAQLEIESDGLNVWEIDETSLESVVTSRSLLLTGGAELTEAALPPGVPIEIGTGSWSTPEWKEGF